MMVEPAAVNFQETVVRGYAGLSEEAGHEEADGAGDGVD